MTEWLLLGLVVLLIAANGLFVAAEFSLVTVDRSTVETEAERGDARSQSLAAALRTLSTQLSGAQLGITVTSLVVGFIAEPSIATLLRGPVGMTGLGDGAATAISVGVAFVIATFAQMVFGELVPKNWAIAEPLRVGRVVVGFQRGFTASTRPLISFLNGTANRILRLVGVEPQEELASARSPQELSSLAGRSAQQGTLESGTADLLARSIEFGDRTAADVMTPRPRVRFVGSGDPVEQLLQLAGSTGHARFPVLGDGVDDVVGMVHFKHGVAVPPAERASRTVADVMHAVRAVPASMELDPLLGVLREPGLQMAVVVDEYGGTDGVVTLEDLVEEIVGEIEDEQDAPVEGHRQLADGGWRLSGLLRPDEVDELVGIHLPEARETDTLGGLVTEHLGHLPDVGDGVVLEVSDAERTDDVGLPTSGRVALEVVRLDGRRVDRVTLYQLPADDDEPAADQLPHADREES